MTQYPVVIEVTGTGDRSRVKATTSIERALEGGRSIEADLRFVEMDYQATLAGAGAALASAGRSRYRDPRAYWLAGRFLADFLDRLEMHDFYLVDMNKAPARHLGVSESSIKRIIAFYRRYPDQRNIDMTIPWSTYRDNKEP